MGRFFVYFEWDPIKSKRNERKHGVSFVEASTVFGDPFARVIDDPVHSTPTELRELILGESVRRRILVVSYVNKSDNWVRIISARKATPRERKRYEERT